MLWNCCEKKRIWSRYSLQLTLCIFGLKQKTETQNIHHQQSTLQVGWICSCLYNMLSGILFPGMGSLAPFMMAKILPLESFLRILKQCHCNNVILWCHNINSGWALHAVVENGLQVTVTENHNSFLFLLTYVTCLSVRQRASIHQSFRDFSYHHSKRKKNPKWVLKSQAGVQIPILTLITSTHNSAASTCNMVSRTTNGPTGIPNMNLK